MVDYDYYAQRGRSDLVITAGTDVDKSFPILSLPVSDDPQKAFKELVSLANSTQIQRSTVDVFDFKSKDCGAIVGLKKEGAKLIVAKGEGSFILHMSTKEPIAQVFCGEFLLYDRIGQSTLYARAVNGEGSRRISPSATDVFSKFFNLDSLPTPSGVHSAKPLLNGGEISGIAAAGALAVGALLLYFGRKFFGLGARRVAPAEGTTTATGATPLANEGVTVGINAAAATLDDPTALDDPTTLDDHTPPRQRSDSADDPEPQVPRTSIGSPDSAIRGVRLGVGPDDLFIRTTRQH